VKLWGSKWWYLRVVCCRVAWHGQGPRQQSTSDEASKDTDGGWSWLRLHGELVASANRLARPMAIGAPHVTRPRAAETKHCYDTVKLIAVFGWTVIDRSNYSFSFGRLFHATVAMWEWRALQQYACRANPNQILDGLNLAKGDSAIRSRVIHDGNSSGRSRHHHRTCSHCTGGEQEGDGADRRGVGDGEGGFGPGWTQGMVASGRPTPARRNNCGVCRPLG
jgi:hypothetical protein